jgi:hypothetical protein
MPLRAYIINHSGNLETLYASQIMPMRSASKFYAFEFHGNFDGMNVSLKHRHKMDKIW